MICLKQVVAARTTLWLLLRNNGRAGRILRDYLLALWPIRALQAQQNNNTLPFLVLSTHMTQSSTSSQIALPES
jgi:hypothetical protein